MGATDDSPGGHAGDSRTLGPGRCFNIGEGLRTIGTLWGRHSTTLSTSGSFVVAWSIPVYCMQGDHSVITKSTLEEARLLMHTTVPR